MQGVFNPNILIYHPPNSTEGLHFSAFHFYRSVVETILHYVLYSAMRDVLLTLGMHAQRGLQ